MEVGSSTSTHYLPSRRQVLPTEVGITTGRASGLLAGGKTNTIKIVQRVLVGLLAFGSFLLAISVITLWLARTVKQLRA
jgi:hypothetical protein